MVQEKSDIEKKLDGLPVATVIGIETKALNALADEIWCKKNKILFVSGYNLWKNYGNVDYSDARQRTAVEIFYQEKTKQEIRDSEKIHSSYRKFIPRRKSSNIPPQQSEPWYL